MPTDNQKTISVLFITRAYGQTAGGMERLSYELIEAAKGNKHLTVSVIAPWWKPLASLPMQRLLSAVFAVTVVPYALFVARTKDVVHIGDPVLSLVGWLIQKIWRKPIAVTVHGLDIVYDSGLYKYYLTKFFQNFALYLPISSHVTKILAARGVTGNIFLLRPGVHDRYSDSTIRREDLQSISALKNINLSSKIIFTAGRLIKRKGHAWFIQHVLPALPADVIYIIAGDGPEKILIEKTARESGVSSRVVLLGRVSDHDLKILYNTIDVFVQPNITLTGDVEGFGLVLLEAALCGRSVIAASTEGVRDAIEPGKNGVLVEIANPDAWQRAIQQELQHPSIRDGRTYTKDTFSWNTVAAKFTNALRSTVSESRK
ncbi:MAG: glycosyltransferase family 4 protein [Candidatus Andersenbacteria bacterium]|nr:glycosyltransferase family 4 protein [Candidatus Andersenbacteria bacterium]MBI3250288.1 glycosyltransferase family 4 protein [Candidatus Andersenbacteria bacterium]